MTLESDIGAVTAIVGAYGFCVLASAAAAADDDAARARARTSARVVALIGTAGSHINRHVRVAAVHLVEVLYGSYSGAAAAASAAGAGTSTSTGTSTGSSGQAAVLVGVWGTAVAAAATQALVVGLQDMWSQGTTTY